MNGIEIIKAGIEKKISGDLELTERKKKNKIKKELAEIERVQQQKEIKNIDIIIEWKKSQTWGYNPKLEAKSQYIDNTWEQFDGYKVSGCGYDKESTVVANLLNDIMKNELLKNIDRINKDKKNDKLPYGIMVSYIEQGVLPSFSGGIGINCYYKIMEYLGYALEKTASGKTFDAYRITKK